MNQMSKKKRFSDYFLLIFFAAYSLLPILWVVVTSLKTNQELVRNGPLALPQEWLFSNYVKAWEIASTSCLLKQYKYFKTCYHEVIFQNEVTCYEGQAHKNRTE